MQSLRIPQFVAHHSSQSGAARTIVFHSGKPEAPGMCSSRRRLWNMTRTAVQLLSSAGHRWPRRHRGRRAPGRHRGTSGARPPSGDVGRRAAIGGRRAPRRHRGTSGAAPPLVYVRLAGSGNVTQLFPAGSDGGPGRSRAPRPRPRPRAARAVRPLALCGNWDRPLGWSHDTSQQTGETDSAARSAWPHLSNRTGRRRDSFRGLKGLRR